MYSSFFPMENLIHLHYIFPHYTQILFIHCILLSILLIPKKITSQNPKDALHFLYKNFCLSRVSPSVGREGGHGAWGGGGCTPHSMIFFKKTLMKTNALHVPPPSQLKMKLPLTEKQNPPH